MAEYNSIETPNLKDREQFRLKKLNKLKIILLQRLKKGINE